MSNFIIFQNGLKERLRLGNKYYKCKNCGFEIPASEEGYETIMANHFIKTGHANYTKIDEKDIPKEKGIIKSEKK